MRLLFDEQNESVLWVDPRGRQLGRDELALLAFRNITEWERLFGEADAPVCVRALRTKNEVLSLDRAEHLARQRMRRLSSSR